MNDLQIKYFLAVGTNLSFTRTSQEMYVSQPAISKQIKMLEAELGVKLFYRKNKKTELTEAGKIMYDYFGRSQLELREALEKARQAQERTKMTLRVGFLEGWDLSGVMPEFIERMKDASPDIDVEIDCAGTRGLASAILNGSMDLAVTLYSDFYDLAELKCQPAGRSRKVLLYSAGSACAGKEDLSMSDFREELFIAPSQMSEHSVIDIVQSYCRPYGFTPKVKFVHNFEAMIAYVRNNMGVAFADENTWVQESMGILKMPIDITEELTIVSAARDRRPMIAAAADILKEIDWGERT